MNPTQATILAVFLALAAPVALRIVLALIQIRKMVEQDMETGKTGRILETTRAYIADEEPIIPAHPNWNSPEPVGRRAPIPPPPPKPPPIQLCVCPLCGHHHRPSPER